MIKRPCLGRCGRLVSRGSYCRRCNPDRGRKRVTPGRGDAAKFRAAVLARAGNRCQLCGLDTATLARLGRRLQAHHVRAVVDGGSNRVDNGIAACTGRGGCHGKADQAQRRRRRKP